ncbi:hypothetical protein BJY52DRAFT_1156726, partial [Lactarius psammicola]
HVFPPFPSGYSLSLPAWWTSLYPLWSQKLHGPLLLDQRLVTTGFLTRPLWFATKRNKLRSFYAPVLLRCPTCGCLGSSLRFSRHLPSLKTTAPSNLRLRSPIPISSAHRTTTPPQASSSITSPLYGRLRRFSRTTKRDRPCGPKSRPAYRRTFNLRGSSTEAPSA